MNRRSHSRERPSHKTTAIYSSDHDRYREEGIIFDALTRAIKEYNHRMVGSNIQLGTLREVEKNRNYVVVPFTTMQVSSFTKLAADISKQLGAEVDISADIDIDSDAKIHFSFNVLKEGFGKSHSKHPVLAIQLGYIAVALALLFVWFYVLE